MTLAAQGYGHPSRNAPQWYVGYLTYRAGLTHSRTTSLTGSGFMYRRDNLGTFQPVVIAHSGPTNSLTGSGILPRRMPSIAQLLVNPSGSNSGA